MRLGQDGYEARPDETPVTFSPLEQPNYQNPSVPSITVNNQSITTSIRPHDGQSGLMTVNQARSRYQGQVPVSRPGPGIKAVPVSRQYPVSRQSPYMDQGRARTWIKADPVHAPGHYPYMHQGTTRTCTRGTPVHAAAGPCTVGPVR